ncbi:hypothetical protein VaNZ11_013992 [Volvox africanus]|uniref:Uncharacterized protein n=1 Tax=Volvox africanus TaxID=51714 RepID=A0ABQ5SHG1_9CHLO|nr:hypothetical protein VaNZ11_013992 [Volvox africanus]
MNLSSEARNKVVAVFMLSVLLSCLSQGESALIGVARLAGPLRSCLVVLSSDNGTSAKGSTDDNGNFNISFKYGRDEVVRAVVSQDVSCFDAFTNLEPPFQLAALLPPDAAAGSVGYGSFMGLSYVLDKTQSTNALNITTVRQSMADLYDMFNISLLNFQLDPLQLQPFTWVQSANTTIRSLAVACIAADVQMGALTVLGAALLNASAGAAASVNKMTYFARATAVEGALQLVQLEALRQKIIMEEASPVASTLGGNNDVATNNADDPTPPSPPLPPPPPSLDSLGGLYRTDTVVAILDSAANRSNVVVPSYAVNATAAVIAGIAAYAEVVKEAALLEVAGIRLGLNPFNALVTMTRLAVVQADAAAQMPQLLGSDTLALKTYMLDALPERLRKATVNMTAIHLALGLPAPAASVPARGATHVVGPLSGCMGQANGVWDPSYEAFVTSGAGGLTLAAKGQGLVTVTPYRYCQDGITQLRLTLSVSNLGPAMSAVSVSPVAMLAQGFYTLQASQRLQTISLAQQIDAFTAMGLDLDAYNALMIPPVKNTTASPASLSWIPPSPPPPPPSSTVSNTTAMAFNLSHPLMGSVMAANVQLVGLIYAARAMFSTSCYYAYNMDSMDNADTFTVTLTMYGAVLQAADAKGVLNLNNTQHLQDIFTFLWTACQFNSTDLSYNTSSVGTQQQSGTGTFLSGGSASAIGATSGRRRSGLALRPSTGYPVSACAATIRSLHAGGLPSQNPALHRRLQTDLFARGITGPELLLWRQLLDLDARPGKDWVPFLRHGGGGGGTALRPKETPVDNGPKDGGRVGLRAGKLVRESSLGVHAVARSLMVYVDDKDMLTVSSKVAEVLAGINTKLQAVQKLSNAAAAASSARSSSAYNLTDLVVTAAELGYVVQQDFYTELSNAMADSYSSGLPLVSAVQSIAARYTGAALLQRMAAAPINRDFICAAQGAQCSSTPQSPSTGGSTNSNKKSNTALYVGVGVGIGVGFLALLLAVWAVRRAMRNRQVTKAVVNNFKAGDMHHMALRLPAAVPPDGHQHGAGHRQDQPLDMYHSLVPAALGSDPTVAQDYPLYPMPVLNASSRAYHYHNNNDTALHSSASNAATAAAAAAAGKGGIDGQPSTGASAGPPLNRSLPPPMFPPLADKGSQGLSVPAAMSQLPSGPPQQQMYLSQPLPHGYPGAAPLQTHRSAHVNNSAYKTYANCAYVRTADTSGFSGGDAAALRDNQNGSINGGMGYTLQTRKIQGALVAIPGQQPPPTLAGHGGIGHGRILDGFTNTAAPGGSSPYNSSLGPQRSLAGFDALNNGDGAITSSSGGGGGAGFLNASIGRRPGLPPLAPYTSVTNPAAPTAALNASLRTIPVNTNFNSSLRPPASSRPPSQSGPSS